MTTLPSGKPAAVLEHRSCNLPRYKVLLHNDDINSMEHVTQALMRVFRFDRIVCEDIMLEAHRNGVAICIVEPLEQAELHRDRLISFSLLSTIEKE